MTSLLIVLSLTSPMIAEGKESSGAGLVLYMALLRGKYKSTEFSYKCSSSFTSSSKRTDSGLEIRTHDLYAIKQYPEADRATKQVFTKTSLENDCVIENVEVIKERHPCLKDEITPAIEKAHKIAREEFLALMELRENGLYLGNINPEDIAYDVIISSVDSNAEYVEVDSWDFSWLPGSHLFKDNSCNFNITLRKKMDPAKRPFTTSTTTSKDSLGVINEIPLVTRN